MNTTQDTKQKTERVELDGSTYRITGYQYLEAQGGYWANAEKKVNGKWYPVKNWDKRAELGQLREGGSQ